MRVFSWCWLPLLVAAGCSRPSSDGGAGVSTVRVAGSTAILPFATEAANAYMREHPHTAVRVEAGGSKAGLAQVAAGSVDVGNSDVFATGAMAPQLEDHRVGVVGFAAMANKGAFDAGITSLSLDQLKKIFRGEVTSWSQVGGKDQPIVVINRAKSSGTRAAFGSIVLGGDDFVAGTQEQESSALVQTTLLQTAGAISYLALAYRHDSLQVFAVDGVEPTAETIASGKYPVWSYEHMYTRGTAQGEARAFIDFVLSAPVQEGPLTRSGFVPIARMKVSRDSD